MRDLCGATDLGFEEYGNPNLVVITRITVMIVVMYNVEMTLLGFLITITSGHKKLKTISLVTCTSLKLIDSFNTFQYEMIIRTSN